MPKYKAVLLCATLVMGLPTFALAQSETGQAEPAVKLTAETVLAKVGDIEVTLGHLIASVEGLGQQESSLSDDILLEGLTERLIQEAAVSQSETERTLATKFRLENDTRALVAREIVNGLAVGIEVSEDDIKAAYDARFGSFSPGTEYNASHILVETEDEAKALVETLKGGEDFAELAKEKSIGPSGPGGGDLGWFPRGTMVEPFQVAIEALKVGDVSDPVKTEFGWHIIKLMDTRIPEVPAIETLAGELQQEVFQQKLRQGLAELTAATEIVRTDLSGIDPAVIRDRSLIGR